MVFVGLVVGLLALPGGQVVGDTTSNIHIDGSLPELQAGAPVVAPFVASNDRMSTVYVTFGTFGGDSQCDLEVTLHERVDGAAPGAGPELAAHEIACSQLADQGHTEVLSWDPIEDSAGRPYDLVIERIDHDDSLGAVIMAGAPKGDALLALVDGQPQELSAAVRPEYDPQPHRWDHIAQTLERLAAYGPQWGGPLVIVGLIALLGVLLALGPVALRSTRTLLVVVGVLALTRGLIWSATVPALEGMDEPAHFAYVQFLAEEREFPGHVDNHESFSEQLYGAIDGLNIESTVPGDRPDFSPGGEDRLRAELDGLSATGGGGGPGSMYAPFYYLPAVPFYEAGGGDFLTQITLVRLWSVLLGVFAAGLLVAIGRQLFPGSSTAQLGFVVAGVLQPMVAHQFAIVNNDGWVITAGFAAIAVGLALARRGRAPGLALLAGVVLGAALLGKPFAIACAVPLGLGWLIGKVRARQRSVRVLLGEAGLVVLGFVLTYGLWTLNAARLHLNTSAVPDQTGTGQTLEGFVQQNFGGNLHAVIAIWAHQLWGDFGWVRIPFPPPVPLGIFLAEIMLGLAVVAWVVLALREAAARRRARAGAPMQDSVELPEPATVAEDVRSAPLPIDVRIAMMAATVAGTIFTLYAAGWLYYMATGLNNLLQGRYALLAIPAFLALPALLIERFSRGRVRPAAVNTVLAFVMVALNLLGLLVMFEGFYG